jgi:hypothetical protein
MRCGGSTVKRMGMLALRVRKMKVLTVKLERVSDILYVLCV